MAGIAGAELRLGTRGSQLALWQAHAVATRLEQTGGPRCRIVVIKTAGDRLQEAPLSEVGGKRLFVKEIEDALLRSEIDLAVHSSKDMPAVLPAGLTIGAALPREDPLDAIVLPGGGGPDPISGDSSPVAAFDRVASHLGSAPTFGTSSVRRTAQLTRAFPAATFEPIRGNLDTRLRKLDAGGYDALVLAAAGLRRLGMESRLSASVPASVCVPAPGQGIVAVEIREADRSAAAALQRIDDFESHAALDAERAVVEALAGGCQTPIGVLASPVAEGNLELVAVVVSLDGKRMVRASEQGRQRDAAALGQRVGAALLGKGAAAILAEADQTRGAVQGIQP